MATISIAVFVFAASLTAAVWPTNHLAAADDQYQHADEPDPRLQYHQCYECKSTIADDDLRRCATDNQEGYYQRSCPTGTGKCVKYSWSEGDEHAVRLCASTVELKALPVGCVQNVEFVIPVRVPIGSQEQRRTVTRCVCDQDKCNAAKSSARAAASLVVASALLLGFLNVKF